MMIKKINIFELLNILKDDYVLIRKWIDFPNFSPGSDIDILVLDRQIASEKILGNLTKYVDSEEVFVQVETGQNHTHIDLMYEKNLFLRIDLVDHFNFFTKFSVQDSLKTKVFISREKLSNGGYSIFVPSNEFELLIRYMEYLEWFDRRPDKLKHLEYIMKNANSSQKNKLIENLHQFLRYNHKKWEGKVPAKKGLFNSFYRRIIKKLKKFGIRR